jgi:hypothetical protein
MHASSEKRRAIEEREYKRTLSCGCSDDENDERRERIT